MDNANRDETWPPVISHTSPQLVPKSRTRGHRIKVTLAGVATFIIYAAITLKVHERLTHVRPGVLWDEADDWFRIGIDFGSYFLATPIVIVALVAGIKGKCDWILIVILLALTLAAPSVLNSLVSFISGR